MWFTPLLDSVKLLMFIEIAAIHTQLRCDPPGRMRAGDETLQRHLLLYHRAAFSSLLVQRGRNLLALCLKISALLLVRFGRESVLHCPYVVIYGVPLLRSDTPYHTSAGIATGNGENYQFRHVFMLAARWWRFSLKTVMQFTPAISGFGNRLFYLLCLTFRDSSSAICPSTLSFQSGRKSA